MINVKELRSGNVILVWSSAFLEYQEVAISAQHILNIEQGWQAKPIPLTEDWLRKFGFKEHKNQMYKSFTWEIEKGSELQLMWIQRVRWAMSINLPLGNWRQLVRDVKYVHQHQNLFYCLTGEELLMK